jgi:RNA polymerase sigma-70 factor (ECF subfamily)
VRAYAWRRGPAVADDVVAETFLVAWRRIDDVPSGHSLPWLLAVARNVRLNLHRGERRRSALAERLQLTVGPWPQPDAPDQRLATALAELPELDREVLLLDAWDGLDNTAIAVARGCSRASVAVRKSRARRKLEALLDHDRTSGRVAATLERTSDAC